MHRNSSKRLHGLLIILMGIHALLLGWLGLRNSPTMNEVAHLPAGLAIWKMGQFDLYSVNPPLVRATAAIPILLTEHREDWSRYSHKTALRPEWNVGEDFVRANGESSRWLFTRARWFCIPFSLIGLMVCWHWGRELSGDQGGVVAATLWCFFPSILGHGSLITPDIAAVSLGTLAAWRYSNWLAIPSWREAFFAGTALGLALLTKSYWIVLLVIWPLLWVIMRTADEFLPVVAEATKAFGDPQSRPKLLTSSATGHFLSAARQITCRRLVRWTDRERLTELSQLAMILVLAVHLLNSGYLYNGTGRPLGSFDFYSQTFTGKQLIPQYDQPENRFRETIFSGLAVPFPADYLLGIDHQKRDLERPHWNYLLGEWRMKGWWYYYIVGLFVKVPVGAWGLFLWGIVRLLKSADRRTIFRTLAPLAIPAFLLFIIVSSETGMNHHVRYVFPILPVIILLASASVRQSSIRINGRCQKYGPAFLLIASIIESLSCYPYSLSYFNLAAGGMRNGPNVLLHSNVDWGQDLLRLREWIDDHPDARPLTIAPLAHCPPEALGIDYPSTPSGPVRNGWHVISVQRLLDIRGDYREYREHQPVDQIGSTLNVYHIESVENRSPFASVESAN